MRWNASLLLPWCAAAKKGLCRSIGVRQSVAHQPRADVLEHQANAGIRLFELVERSAVHHARIRVRQEPGTLQHQFAHGRHVIKRTYVSLLRKEFSRFRENAFRLIPQAEESFLATRATASFRKRQHLLRRTEVRPGPSR